jgi:chorismate synthase
MNTIGNNFRITIFGASHTEHIGIVIDGVPCGIKINADDFVSDINRRKPIGIGETLRKEVDKVHILSGFFNEYTTGSAITLMIDNVNVDESSYKTLKFRPSHTDFVANKKYLGYNDYRGGGIFSGRMTILLVLAGVIAKKLLKEIGFNAKVLSINGIKYTNDKISELISKTKNEGDTLGGIVECKINNVPIGIGEPFFYSIESVLSHLIFSIPGIMGIEFGDGFTIASKKGSEINDVYIDKDGKTKTNHFGGVNGGISNGNKIVFRVAVRPPASIQKPQTTYNFETNKIEELVIGGRHDVCFVERVPVIIEAVSAIGLLDLFLNKNN